MSSLAERNRQRLIAQLENDPRLGKEKVLSGAPMIRGSFITMVVAGIVGAFIAQALLGAGGLQFAIGLFVGYGAYVTYLLLTMGPPKVIGVMAVLTKKRLVLLGSRRVGVAAEWRYRDLESIDVLRRGNLLVMGKIRINPVGQKGIIFYISNRQMGSHFVETFNEQHRG